MENISIMQYVSLLEAIKGLPIEQVLASANLTQSQYISILQFAEMEAEKWSQKLNITC